MDIRVIELEAKSGHYNNQLDQEILQGILNGTSPPTILFSNWKPTISIGNLQHSTDVDQQAAKKHGVDVVRRRSGGQAVYLDEGYIVFSVMGKREHFPESMDDLRAEFCQSVADTLQRYGVPAEYAAPDNVIINQQRIQTIANSAQMIRGPAHNKAVLIHGSIRYDKPDEKLTDILRISNTPLHEYTQPILNALSYVKEHSKVSKEELIQDLTQTFSTYLKGTPATGHIHETVRESRPLLTDKKHYLSKGICYLYVGGENIVEEIQHLLPYSKPSTPDESRYE